MTGHLIIREISKSCAKVSIIPNGLGKNIAFTINRNSVFIDSIQYLNSGLDSLVKNLSDNDFKYLSEEFSGEFLKLVKQKRLYPYEYMDRSEKFSENKLPDTSKFFSSLKNVYISEKYYLKANNIWNKFKINTMGHYHDLYLKRDILLLADIFENFISTWLKHFGLDRCRYFSSLGLSWDVKLKMAGIELELISDIDMHLFFEKGMRGGISCIAKRYSKANNKYIKYYDSDSINESKYITYLDTNNLYGCAVSQYSQYTGFKWLN